MKRYIMPLATILTGLSSSFTMSQQYHHATSKTSMAPLKSSELPKSHVVPSLLRLVDALSHIAMRAENAEDNDLETRRFNSKVDQLLVNVKAIQQLVTLAEMCNAILSRQTADDKSYDQIFNYAFWLCAQRLSKSNVPEAAEGLLRLEHKLEGGDKFHIQLLIDNQATRIPRQSKKPEKRATQHNSSSLSQKTSGH